MIDCPNCGYEIHPDFPSCQNCDEESWASNRERRFDNEEYHGDVAVDPTAYIYSARGPINQEQMDTKDWATSQYDEMRRNKPYLTTLIELMRDKYDEESAYDYLHWEPNSFFTGVSRELFTQLWTEAFQMRENLRLAARPIIEESPLIGNQSTLGYEAERQIELLGGYTIELLTDFIHCGMDEQTAKAALEKELRFKIEDDLWSRFYKKALDLIEWYKMDSVMRRRSDYGMDNFPADYEESPKFTEDPMYNGINIAQPDFNAMPEEHKQKWKKILPWLFTEDEPHTEYMVDQNVNTYTSARYPIDRDNPVEYQKDLTEVAQNGLMNHPRVPFDGIAINYIKRGINDKDSGYALLRDRGVNIMPTPEQWDAAWENGLSFVKTMEGFDSFFGARPSKDPAQVSLKREINYKINENYGQDKTFNTWPYIRERAREGWTKEQTWDFLRDSRPTYIIVDRLTDGFPWEPNEEFDKLWNSAQLQNEWEKFPTNEGDAYGWGVLGSEDWRQEYQYRIVPDVNKKRCETCSAFRERKCKMFNDAPVTENGYCTEWSQTWEPKQSARPKPNNEQQYVGVPLYYQMDKIIGLRDFGYSFIEDAIAYVWEGLTKEQGYRRIQTGYGLDPDNWDETWAMAEKYQDMQRDWRMLTHTAARPGFDPHQEGLDYQYWERLDELSEVPFVGDAEFYHLNNFDIEDAFEECRNQKYLELEPAPTWEQWKTAWAAVEELEALWKEIKPLRSDPFTSKVGARPIPNPEESLPQFLEINDWLRLKAELWHSNEYVQRAYREIHSSQYPDSREKQRVYQELVDENYMITPEEWDEAWQAASELYALEISRIPPSQLKGDSDYRYSSAQCDCGSTQCASIEGQLICTNCLSPWKYDEKDLSSDRPAAQQQQYTINTISARPNEPEKTFPLDLNTGIQETRPEDFNLQNWIQQYLDYQEELKYYNDTREPVPKDYYPPEHPELICPNCEKTYNGYAAHYNDPKCLHCGEELHDFADYYYDAINDARTNRYDDPQWEEPDYGNDQITWGDIQRMESKVSARPIPDPKQQFSLDQRLNADAILSVPDVSFVAQYATKFDNPDDAYLAYLSDDDPVADMIHKEDWDIAWEAVQLWNQRYHEEKKWQNSDGITLANNVADNDSGSRYIDIQIEDLSKKTDPNLEWLRDHELCRNCQKAKAGLTGYCPECNDARKQFITISARPRPGGEGQFAFGNELLARMEELEGSHPWFQEARQAVYEDGGDDSVKEEILSRIYAVSYDPRISKEEWDEVWANAIEYWALDDQITLMMRMRKRSDWDQEEPEIYEEEDSEPDEYDAIISDGSGGYDIQFNGKWVISFGPEPEDWDKAIKYIMSLMEKEGYYPNVWHCDSQVCTEISLETELDKIKPLYQVGQPVSDGYATNLELFGQPIEPNFKGRGYDPLQMGLIGDNHGDAIVIGIDRHTDYEYYYTLQYPDGSVVDLIPEEYLESRTAKIKIADISQNDISDANTYTTDLHTFTDPTLPDLRHRDNDQLEDINEFKDNQGNVYFVYTNGRIYWGRSVDDIISRNLLHTMTTYTQAALSGIVNIETGQVIYDETSEINQTPELKKAFLFALKRTLNTSVPDTYYPNDDVLHSDEEIYNVKMH